MYQDLSWFLDRCWRIPFKFLSWTGAIWHFFLICLSKFRLFSINTPRSLRWSTHFTSIPSTFTLGILTFANCCLVPYTIISVLELFIFNVYLIIRWIISLRHSLSCWRKITSFWAFQTWIWKPLYGHQHIHTVQNCISTLFTAAIYKFNITGPAQEPWGTLNLKCSVLEDKLSIVTFIVLWVKIGFYPFIQEFLLYQSSWKIWSTISNAALRSIVTTRVTWLLSIAFNKSLYIVIIAVPTPWFCRYALW